MDKEIESKINNLLPLELEKVQEFINELLKLKINNRLTNLEYLEKKKRIFCNIDKTHHIKRNGRKNGTQRYWCYDCGKSFSITNNSILSSTQLSYNQLKILLKCMYDYKPLNETSLEIGISRTATFEIQIKIFEALEKIYSNNKLKGIIQVDEEYIRTSFKGFPKSKMPRKSRYNGVDDRTSGISKDQVCILVAIDEYDELIIKVVGNGPASSSMLELGLNNMIEKNSTLVTDSKSSYKEFCKKNNLTLIQIPSGKYKIDNYTINDVNEIMTEISNYLARKRGISSRHLQHHLNFIRYRKIIKYTIDYMEINEAMFVDIILQFSNLKSKDVYSTDMPFDIDEYKKWYIENHPNY